MRLALNWYHGGKMGEWLTADQAEAALLAGKAVDLYLTAERAAEFFATLPRSVREKRDGGAFLCDGTQYCLRRAGGEWAAELGAAEAPRTYTRENGWEYYGLRLSGAVVRGGLTGGRNEVAEARVRRIMAAVRGLARA